MDHLQVAPSQPKRVGKYTVMDIPPPPPKKPITDPKTQRERLRQLLEAQCYLKEPPHARPVPAPGAENQPSDDERSKWQEIFYGPGSYDPNEAQTLRYVWTDFMKPANRRVQRQWWPRKPESNEVVLEKMLEECFDDYKKDHWLLHNKRDLRIVRRWCKRRINHHHIRHFQSRNRTQMLNQSVNVAVAQNKC